MSYSLCMIIHDVAYALGIDREASGSVNFYLNARDDDHKTIVGLIFDFWWLG